MLPFDVKLCTNTEFEAGPQNSGLKLIRKTKTFISELNLAENIPKSVNDEEKKFRRALSYDTLAILNNASLLLSA